MNVCIMQSYVANFLELQQLMLHSFLLQMFIYLKVHSLPFFFITQSTFSTQNPRTTDGHVTFRIARYDWLGSHLCKQSAKKLGQICFEC